MSELSRVYCLLTVTYWELATRTFLIHLKAFLTYQTKSTSNQRPFSQSRRLLPPSPDRRPKRQNSNEKWWINKRIIYRLLVGFLLCPLFSCEILFPSLSSWLRLFWPFCSCCCRVQRSLFFFLLFRHTQNRLEIQVLCAFSAELKKFLNLDPKGRELGMSPSAKFFQVHFCICAHRGLYLSAFFFALCTAKTFKHDEVSPAVKVSLKFIVCKLSCLNYSLAQASLCLFCREMGLEREKTFSPTCLNC